MSDRRSLFSKILTNIASCFVDSEEQALAFVLAGILLCTLATPAFAKRHHKKHHHHHHSTQQAQR